MHAIPLVWEMAILNIYIYNCRNAAWGQGGGESGSWGQVHSGHCDPSADEIVTASHMTILLLNCDLLLLVESS